MARRIVRSLTPRAAAASRGQGPGVRCRGHLAFRRPLRRPLVHGGRSIHDGDARRKRYSGRAAPSCLSDGDHLREPGRADGGATWRGIGPIYRSPDWFCGYPAVARLSDDTFLCVFFTAIVDGNSDVVGVVLRDRS
jgi:hypothetical protein